MTRMHDLPLRFVARKRVSSWMAEGWHLDWWPNQTPKSDRPQNADVAVANTLRCTRPLVPMKSRGHHNQGNMI